MQRIGIYFRLKPGKADEYSARHRDIWPQMRSLLTEAGICNYSIWNLDDMLFAYYEVNDEEKANAILSQSEVYAKWRKDMEEYIYIEPISDQKEWPMKEVFYHL